MSTTKWCYPLHTLVDQEELNQLLLYSTSSISPTSPSADSAKLTISLEWRRRTLQNLCLSVLHYGEVKPCLDVMGAGSKKLEQPLPERVVMVRKVKLRTSSLNWLPKKKTDGKLEKKDASSKISNVHYNTFIISNTIESRRALMPDVVPELQLQKIAKGVYGSILLSLLNARPLTQALPADKTEDVSDIYLQNKSPVFAETISMLVCSLEQLLKQASGSHQLLNDVDMFMVLSFWHEMNYILTPIDQSPGLCYTDNLHQVTSSECCSLLVNYLLSQPSIPPKLWQPSIINITSSLLYKKHLFDDYDKLLAVFVKFFLSSNSNMSALVPWIVGILLSEDRSLVSHAHKDNLSGNCLLLEILITALRNRYVWTQNVCTCTL